MTSGQKTALKSLGVAVGGYLVAYLTQNISSFGISATYLPLVTAALVAAAHWLPKPNASSSLNPLSTSSSLGSVKVPRG